MLQKAIDNYYRRYSDVSPGIRCKRFRFFLRIFVDIVDYDSPTILSKNKKYPPFLSKPQRMHFSISINLPFFFICETSADNMQEMPTIFLPYDSYLSKTSFSKFDNNLVLHMRKGLFCFAVCPAPFLQMRY